MYCLLYIICIYLGSGQSVQVSVIKSLYTDLCRGFCGYTMISSTKFAHVFYCIHWLARTEAFLLLLLMKCQVGLIGHQHVGIVCVWYRICIMICLLSVRRRKMDVDGTVWGFDKAQETVGSAEARIWSLPLSLLAMLGLFQFLVFLGGRYVSLGDPGWLL